VLHAEDPTCSDDRPGFACLAPGYCRIPNAQRCGTDLDCDSGSCELDVEQQRLCCESPCGGVCQRCGSDGVCDDFPPFDSGCTPRSCPLPTICLQYSTPVLNACASNGACQECEAIVAPAETPCGVGSVCNGKGACEFNGRGVVAAGSTHTCAVRDNGNVVCWGRNVEGELGTAFALDHVGDDETPRAVGLELDFEQDVVAVSAGYRHTCVLFLEGDVRCWGASAELSLGLSDAALLGVDAASVQRLPGGQMDPLEAADVRLPGRAIAISAALDGDHTCAILDTGGVVCWGQNLEGECGSGDGENVAPEPGGYLPLVDLGGRRALEVKASVLHTCALLEDQTVTCWGRGRYGQLGYGNKTDRPSPEGAVPIGAPAIHIVTGSAFTCAVLTSGGVRCWGHNGYGQLGYGHTQDIGDDETPADAATMPGPDGEGTLGGDVDVGGTRGVVEVAIVASGQAACARFAGGAVRCWGRNGDGQLGYGNGDSIPSVVSTPAELDATRGDLALNGGALALSDGGRCALVEASTAADDPRPLLYCWGKNDEGQLGLPGRSANASTLMPPADLGPVEWR
jgi:alpha-tubulin suppressor-like RCC1 family protein